MGTGRSWCWPVCGVEVKEGLRVIPSLPWLLDGGTLREHREGEGLKPSVWDILRLSVWVGGSQEIRGNLGRRRKETAIFLGLAQERGVVAGAAQRNELAIVGKMRTSVEKVPFHMTGPVLHDGGDVSLRPRVSAVNTAGPSSHCSLG